MRATTAHRAGRWQLGSAGRGDRRRRVGAAVRRGEAVSDPADAALAAVHAAKQLRRFGRRSSFLPFGRDFALVGAGAGVLALLTDMSWGAKAAMLMLALAVLIVAELVLDTVVARRRANAAKSEQENLALVLDDIASRYRTATPRPRMRALPPPRPLAPPPPP